MEQRIDRQKVFAGTMGEISDLEKKELAELTPAERFQIITYLRECFYGPEATTGRLQRVYRELKQS